MNAAPYTKIIVRNMRVDMFIGVHDFEKEKKQPVIVNVEAFVEAPQNWREDNIENVLNYHLIVEAIEKLTAGGHIELVETLAEEIAAFCTKLDKIHAVMVKVEKLEIYEAVDGVGIEIFRQK